MVAKGKRKTGGGKLARSEVITIRLDPRLRFGAELAAAKHRRTLSSFAEWAIEEALKETKVGDKDESAYEVMQKAWDIDEGWRFYKYAKKCSRLLKPNEEKLWKVMRDAEDQFDKCMINFNLEDVPYQEVPEWHWERIINKFFEDFKRCAEGKIDEEEIYKNIFTILEKFQ
jgi:hypothetical protein